MLRAAKHRFGSTSELGLFEMTERGLEGVPDPSGLFLTDRMWGNPGSIVVPRSAPDGPPGMTLLRAATVKEAIEQAGLAA